MSDEWGPLIKHDGAAPLHLPKCDCTILVRFHGRGDTCDGPLARTAPNWFWRWQWVWTGWFRRELRPVCDDPAFAPIISYRIKRPKGLILLCDIAAEPELPIARRVKA